MGMNFQDVIRDVHDPANHSLKTSDSGATIYAVVNTAAAGDSVNNIGFATVSVSNPTLYAVVNTGGANTGNITLNPSPNFIGIVTVANPGTFTGNVTLDAGSRTGILGNVTLSDSKTYIGLTTATIGNNPVLGAGVNGIGFATVHIGTPTIFAVVNTGAAGITDVTSDSGVTVYQGGTWTVTQASAARTITSGTITAVTDITNPIAIKGNLTLSDSKGYIGLVTVTQASSTRTITGNLTLSDAKAYIGLTTSTLGAGLAGIGFATVAISTPTLYAVVNTGAAGTTDITSDSGVTVYQGGTWTVTQASAARTITSGTLTAVTDITNPVALKGNLTLSDAKTYVGLVTATIGNSPVLGTGIGNIGFATVSISTPTLFAVVNAGAASDPNIYIGLVTADIGTIKAWPNPNTFIGLVTVAPHSLTASTLNIGSVSVLGGGIGLNAGVNSVGFASVTPVAAWPDPKGYIGLVTITGSLAAASGNVTLDDGSLVGLVAGVNNIGFATVTIVNNAGNATLNPSPNFIGLVTAWSRNAGTTKTLIPLTINFSTTSVATIFVPSATFKATHVLLNANATTRVSIKSGVTYLTGNASIGITLLPGGGWVENGSPDSPVYIGLAAAASFVVEKSDITTSVGGKVMYFDE